MDELRANLRSDDASSRGLEERPDEFVSSDSRAAFVAIRPGRSAARERLTQVKADKNKYFKVRGLLEAKESIKEARKVDRGVADSEEDE